MTSSWAMPPLDVYLKESVSVSTPQHAFHTRYSTIHDSQVKEQPRCPSADGWIKEMWFKHTVEFYSLIKKNETMLFARKWMEPKSVMLCKMSWKDNYHMAFPFCGN